MQRTALALLAVLLLAACASQPPPPSFANVPGFFSGLGHGITAPLAWLASLFTDVRIYAWPNGGVWYDSGFLLGLAAWGGGAGAAGR